MIEDNSYVYCTDCENGEKLIGTIIKETNLPQLCQNCYPYNPEDSHPISIRINYNKKRECSWKINLFHKQGYFG